MLIVSFTLCEYIVYTCIYIGESILLNCEIKKAGEVSQKSGWVNWGWPVRKQNIYNLILHRFLGILPTSLIINIFFSQDCEYLKFWQLYAYNMQHPDRNN